MTGLVTAAVLVWRFVLARPDLPANVVQLSGLIENDDSAIAPKTASRIIAITVREGDVVQAGQTICNLGRPCGEPGFPVFASSARSVDKRDWFRVDRLLLSKPRFPMLLKRVVVAPLLCALLALGQGQGAVTVISNVTLINPRTTTVTAHQTVVTEGTRIRSIGPSSAALPDGAIMIDGSGQFLIPGLWDAHVHLTKLGKLSLPLFIANGVTGVRDMGSDFRDIQRWRSAIESGEQVGPHIKTSGEILESKSNIDRMKREGTVEPVDRIRIGVANPAEARAAVIRLAREGVDHIKMRTAPDLETFRAVADQAKREALPFSAHPLEPPDELFRSGLRSVEHFLAFPPIAAPEKERKDLFRRMSQSGLFMSDTSVNLDALVSFSYDDVKRRVDDVAGKIDERRRYVCGYLVADWREQLEELKDPGTRKAYGSLRQQLPTLYRNNREMADSGVRFLAGTDSGVLLMYPGFSLHDELRKLVKDAGLSPNEVLRAATYNLAGFYGKEHEFGSIEPGQSADLVLLREDPIKNIRNTTQIAGVMAGGRWFDRRALDGLLKDVERKASSSCEGSSLKEVQRQ